ncbi:MAG TPA: hypothetical protein VGL00_11460 [Terracidiphilus sp.]|jgi:hypothetical protein
MADVTNAGADVFLFGIPLIALLIFGFFRLDQVFTSRKSVSPKPPDTQTASKRHEKSMRSDPDGRPWEGD